MTRRELACRIADACATDDLVVSLIKFADGAVVLLRDREELAFRVLDECQGEDEESAIGWSKDRRVHCVVAPFPSAATAASCRLAEELHLYDGLESPLAADAGLRVIDETDRTLSAFAAGVGADDGP